MFKNGFSQFAHNPFLRFPITAEPNTTLVLNLFAEITKFGQVSQAIKTKTLG
ncbi:hypothetical protein LEP1GSC170_5582 [Leptospira interrogans serovar Bataviae str. HAI135]|nr:hypothetical protein LEP1GSC170_5582 [Leptospira interrogans serovar Bataviae str. HAI135]